MTPSGIEPATFRLVAQCLNEPHQRVPPKKISRDWNWKRHSNFWANVKLLIYCM